MMDTTGSSVTLNIKVFLGAQSLEVKLEDYSLHKTLADLKNDLYSKLKHLEPIYNNALLEIALRSHAFTSDAELYTLQQLNFDEGDCFAYFRRMEEQQTSTASLEEDEASDVPIFIKLIGKPSERMNVSLYENTLKFQERAKAKLGFVDAVKMTLYKPEGSILIGASSSATLESYSVVKDSTVIILPAPLPTSTHRFQSVAAWNPVQSKQTSKGMSAFLSCMHVLENALSGDPNLVTKLLDFCSSVIDFPPAWITLVLFSKKKDLQDEYKAALASAFYAIFRTILPETTDHSHVFENSLQCLAVLLQRVDSGRPSGRSSPYTTTSLTCPVSLQRMKDPVVYIKNDDQVTICDRSSCDDPELARSLPTAAKMASLLLSYPKAFEVITWDWPTYEPPLDVSVDLAEIFTAPVREFGWKAVLAKAQEVIPRQFSFLRITAPLSLFGAKFPCLTLDSSSHLAVCHGPAPCSVGTVDIFCPDTGATSSISPDMLAKQLGCENKDQVVDDREVNEAVYILLDVSQSMCSKKFAKEEAKAEALPLFQLSPEEAKRHIDDFLSSPEGYYAKKCYDKFGFNLLLKELCEDDHYFKSIPAQHAYLADKMKQFKFTIDKQAKKFDPVTLPPANDMQIFIRKDGATIVLMVNLDYKVRDVIGLMLHKAGDVTMDPDLHRLLYNGRDMVADTTLRDNNVEPHATMQSLVRWYAGMQNDYKKVKIELKSSYKTYKFTVMGHVSVRAMAYKLWSKCPTSTPSNVQFWKDLKSSGDGFQTGTLLELPKRSAKYAVQDITGNLTLLAEIFPGRHKSSSEMSRMDITKQLFNAFVNRCQAYHYATNIGLITFGSSVTVACELTPLFEVFRDVVEQAHPEGETTLYDAIALGGQSLENFCKTKPNCVKRLVVLTDGADTESRTLPEIATNFLQRNKIILDCICIGEAGNTRLDIHAMCKATGGYSFAPPTLAEALSICELETMLSSNDRPPQTIRSTVNRKQDLELFRRMPLDICNRQTVPARKTPALLLQPVATAEKTLQKAQGDAKMSNSNSTPAQSRNKRLLEEVKLIIKNSHPGYEVFPSQSDLGFWRILLSGTAGSPYESGAWKLYAVFPADYPLSAPEIRFETPVLHCNVNAHGKICHSIFGRNWTSDLRMTTVLNCVYGLLLCPETDDPLDSSLALQFFNQRDLYEKTIREHTAKFAPARNLTEFKTKLAEDEKTLQDVPSMMICKLCMSAASSVCFIPCGHTITCGQCSEKVMDCPMCRVGITSRQRIYF